jgi:hypothetical protein
MDRIYGKPEQPLVARVPPNPVVEMVRPLSLDVKLDLLELVGVRDRLVSRLAPADC